MCTHRNSSERYGSFPSPQKVHLWPFYLHSPRADQFSDTCPHRVSLLLIQMESRGAYRGLGFFIQDNVWGSSRLLLVWVVHSFWFLSSFPWCQDGTVCSHSPAGHAGLSQCLDTMNKEAVYIPVVSSFGDCPRVSRTADNFTFQSEYMLWIS